MDVTVTDTVERTWYLEDVQFESGATATGSFAFDVDTDTYSNINISISNENTTDTYGVLLPTSVGNATFMLTIPEFMSDLTGQPRFNLTFAESLTNAGGTVDISIELYSNQAVCPNPACSGFFPSAADLVTSGKVTTVQPTNTAPILAVIGNQTVAEGQLLEFTISASDPNTGDTLTFQLGNAPTGATLTDNTDGTATFSWTPGFTQTGNYPDVLITVTDSGGLTAVQSIVITVTNMAEDTTPPTANPVLDPSPNAAGWNNSDVTINWNWNDETGDSGIDTNICATSNLVDGEGITGNLSVCSDLAGNSAESQPFTVKLDKTALNTTFTATSPATSTIGDVSFEFTGSDAHSGISSFECSLDTGGLVGTGPCTSPVSYTVQADGTYIVSVRATDVADNVDPTPASYTFTVDMQSVNQAPTAVTTGTPMNGDAPLVVAFDGSGSTDSDGTISTYAWDFGDGSAVSNLQNPTHTYNTAGNYTATLTVTDNDAATGTATVAITVTNPSESNLLGQWTLDDGIGTIASDTSGNSNDGTVSGAAWTHSGQVDGALDFDGSDDYVDLGNLNASADSLTISAWINADTFTHLSSQDARIVSKATGTGSQDHYFMLSTIKSNGATRLRFRLMTNGSTTTLLGSGGVLTSATWIHVAAVYDGAQMRLYQDGVEVGNTSKTGNIDQNAVAVWIGRNPDGKRPFDGRIDEVYIYDQALTAAEIQVLGSINDN